MDSRLLPIAVLISGGGTTLRNLIQLQQAGELPVDFRVVVSSNETAGGLRFAAKANIRSVVVPREACQSAEEFRDRVFGPCRDAGAELVVMGGFLKHVLIPREFAGRVINIHPALIPAFCGKGFYGRRVHQAILDDGAKVSGCTVHFVDDEFDHGPIILQRTVPVLDDDTVETLAARVFVAECEAYPEAIRQIAAGNLQIEGRVVRRLN